MVKEYLGEKFFNLAFGIVKVTVGCSYWICLITSIVSVILYVAGMKKAGKNVPVSMVVYFLLECLKRCMEDMR